MRALALAVALLATAAAAQPPEGQETPFRPFDAAAFSAHLRRLGASDEQVAAFLGEAAVGAAADTALRAVNREYDRAVALAEAGEPRAALELAKLLDGTGDPYLRAHCRYHLGRVFLDADDPERAVEVFAAYLREDRNRSPLDAEVTFFYAHALAEVPAPALASQALRSFLAFFPDAAERYLAAAQQQLAELEAQDGALHDIADVMKGVERRIRRTDTGKDTQERQQQVVAQLQEILEQWEERERQSGGAPGGLGRPTAPATNSAAPPGATRIGNLNKVPGVADRWGQLRDRDREAIETDLQTKLPGHYQKMLEEYYRRLNAGSR